MKYTSKMCVGKQCVGTYPSMTG